ncbi:MAG: hypothetical protein WC788_01655 [Candidatus Paceibacterota bacterium]|jgi:hypothetical protein
MNDWINGSEDRIRGMDIIQNLFREETMRELNREYSELLASVNERKGYSIEDELCDISKEFESQGMRYSTAPVMTGKGNYVRLVFRKKFIILFPGQTDRSIRLCKLKRELIEVKNESGSNGDLQSLNRMRPLEIKREMIDDEDFFDFEGILNKLPEKIQRKKGGNKAAFLYIIPAI